MTDHTPLPGLEARLLVLLLTLHTAHTGTGNFVGQDLTALGLTDPEDLVGQLTACGWRGTAGDLLASRPENPTPISVPSLMPHEDGTGPFTFGKKMRPKLFGWAQKVVVGAGAAGKLRPRAGPRICARTPSASPR